MGPSALLSTITIRVAITKARTTTYPLPLLEQMPISFVIFRWLLAPIRKDRVATLLRRLGQPLLN